MNDPHGPASSAADPLEGTHYRFLKHIGSGAMGEVVAAEHRALGTQVAVKLLRPEYASHDMALDRFRLESQVLASIARCPNIVQVIDYGHTATERPYLVMEWLDGHTLRQEMEARGPFAPVEAVRLMRQVLSGLGAAHAAGVVHRDIKPANLFLCNADRCEERVVKILDFGVAKLVNRTGSRRGPAPLVQPTAQGMAVGTPRYLAPEQAVGGPVDARTDLYGAGAVLYWMLTGKDPFHDQADAFAVFQAHVKLVPKPPSGLAKHPMPPALDRAILKALAKRPEDRFPSAEHFSRELEAAIVDRPAPGRWPTTAPLDTSAFRTAAPQAAAPGGASTLTVKIPSLARDRDDEVTLRRAPAPAGIGAPASVIPHASAPIAARHVALVVALAAVAALVLVVLVVRAASGVP